MILVGLLILFAAILAMGVFLLWLISDTRDELDRQLSTVKRDLRAAEQHIAVLELELARDREVYDSPGAYIAARVTGGGHDG